MKTVDCYWVVKLGDWYWADEDEVPWTSKQSKAASYQDRSDAEAVCYTCSDVWTWCSESPRVVRVKPKVSDEWLARWWK